MKNFKLIQIIALIAMVAVFSSCSKDEEPEPPTVESQLIGVWNFDEYYMAGELLTDASLPWTYEFLEGGTGERDIVDVAVQPFTWSYDTTTKKLTILIEDMALDGGTLMGETIIAEITKVDASNLWYSYQIDGLTFEERYVK